MSLLNLNAVITRSLNQFFQPVTKKRHCPHSGKLTKEAMLPVFKKANTELLSQVFNLRGEQQKDTGQRLFASSLKQGIKFHYITNNSTLIHLLTAQATQRR